ncbi:Leucine-rich repeat and fibronectin type-III domain-containing protein 4 [Acromyrmex echinatior]|uniref:Leucine-rich repeat and fibronectin type-III domain-containing protein 4 n=1 Tax=Acromyrmex echinatior TaxID=103372 RepID=F4WT56_ACREC|nr:Leucine-rich repeat and fibronectin type-III domain-containing protein 4 [Acromyrmex echinatior]
MLSGSAVVGVYLLYIIKYILFSDSLRVKSQYGYLIMFNIIALSLLFLCNECLCDICETCGCSTSNVGPIIDCHDRHLGTNDVLNFDLLTLDKHRPLNKLILSKNNIVLLPLNELKHLKHLKGLDLSQNKLDNIHSDILKNLNELEDLDYSSNLLWDFDISVLNTESSLSKFNLSYNRLNKLEKSSKSATKLKVFDVSHNNLVDLNFLDVMPELEYLNLSFNKFTTLPLDLSNNCFTHLPSKLFNINVYNKNVSNLKYLINLQGNPFICNCSLQWMLNELIPKLYITNPNLLEDLRCAEPPALANKRMIHWYKWKGEIFCDEFSHSAERMTINIAKALRYLANRIVSNEQVVCLDLKTAMMIR